jgi:subtilisin family serine protease
MVVASKRFVSLSYWVLSVGLMLPAMVAAQPAEVFPNQYVVELNVSGLGLDDSQLEKELEASGLSVLSELGDGVSRLVSPTASALSSATAAQAVPYDEADTFCTDLMKSGMVKSCSPNFKLYATATPNDPRLSDLWGLNASTGADAYSAWDITTGSDSIVVAVIDTGIDYNHSDLSANMWVNSAEVPGNGRDDDGNGFIDDIHGVNTINDSGNPLDDNSHGSHVAGTIGARGNNGVGVAGVNWRVKLMALKFLDSQGGGALSDAVQAINYMVSMKRRGVNIRVANNSWGGGGFSQSLYNAIAAAEAEGIIFVAAAGNSTNDNDMFPSYPGSYELNNVVSVAAIDANQNLASFSNYGASTVDIAAPGVSILSTSKSGGYVSYSGTSMATPHVSGALALLLAAEPNLSVTDAINRLYMTGKDLPTLYGAVRTGRTLSIGRLLRNETTPIPGNDNSDQNCRYNISEIQYNPDYSADSAPIVVQADELGYYTVGLPFSFPYFGVNVNSITLSPNGVIYTRNAPASYDYTTGNRAPLSSIAALHTDLVSSSDPWGVRYSASADKVTVYWKVKHYYARSNGDVEVRTTIYSDGRIQNFISMPDSSTEAAVRTFATVGLTGATADKSFTYAYNSSAIRNGLSLEFSPNCSQGAPESSASVNAMQFLSLSKNSSARKAKPGRMHQVSLYGAGSGQVEVEVVLDGSACSGKARLNLNNGYGIKQFVLPRSVQKYEKIGLKVKSVRKSLRVDGDKSTKLKKRARSRQFTKTCGDVLAELSN